MLRLLYGKGYRPVLLVSGHKTNLYYHIDHKQLVSWNYNPSVAHKAKYKLHLQNTVKQSKIWTLTNEEDDIYYFYCSEYDS